MPTHADFLQAILADPDDDTPRLIYADWLEEQGDPRGEFIRVQCELAKDPAEAKRRKTLVKREKALRKTIEKQWLEPVGESGAKLEFRRGLPERASMEFEAFLAHGENLLRHFPIRQLQLNVPGELVPALGVTPLLARIPSLEIRAVDNRTSGPPQGMDRFWNSVNVGNLTALNLHDNQLNGDNIRAMARTSRMGKLRTLNLYNNRIRDEGVQALAESDRFSKLQWLNIGGNGVGDAGVEALARSASLAQLRFLGLFRSDVGDAGASALAQSEQFPELEELDLGLCLLADPGALAFADQSRLPSLKRISFWISRRQGFAFSETTKERLRRRFGESVEIDTRHTEVRMNFETTVDTEIDEE